MANGSLFCNFIRTSSIDCVFPTMSKHLTRALKWSNYLIYDFTSCQNHFWHVPINPLETDILWTNYSSKGAFATRLWIPQCKMFRVRSMLGWHSGHVNRLGICAGDGFNFQCGQREFRVISLYWLKSTFRPHSTYPG